jgi:hypothetical protein
MPFTLPLDPDNSAHFQALLHALSDPKLRQGLRAQKELPDNIRQLVSMIDDARFLEMSNKIASRYSLVRQGKESLDTLKSDGAELLDFLQSRYPDALKALRRYGERVAPAMQRNQAYLGPALSVAVNTQAVANAAVYVNVAAATNVAVALEAVAVVGVVVT